ncbi:MAG: hypothetical protein CME70_05530 [Halobacteriovorax sp.]|nr:hypothetical protein [Halobacteriovorax sp.]
MTDTESIVMIYDYQEGGESKPSAYYLKFAFDETGLIELEPMIDVYEELIQKQPESDEMPLGPFESLNFLNQFAFKVCEKSDGALVSLLSVQDYNFVMEEADSGTTLFQKFVEKGNQIQNLDHRSKSGILGKLFH